LGYGQISEEALVRDISVYANDLCGRCHEPRGGKEVAPRISGQQREYIEAQLNAFRRTSRLEPEAYDCMWGLSSALSDRLTAALASYFASQPARSGISGDPIRIQAGAALFTRDRQDGIPSCAQCHGQDAGGGGSVPRLAGQLAPYLGRQMQVIRARFRDSGIMHGILKDLNDEQMRSLAVYLQSL
jgi:cytochrome c553